MDNNESITTAPEVCRTAQTQDRPVFLPAADIYETSSAVTRLPLLDGYWELDR